MDVNCLAAVAGGLLVLFGLVELMLGALIAVGPFYLLIKLGGLADAVAKDRRTAPEASTSMVQPWSATVGRSRHIPWCASAFFAALLPSHEAWSAHELFYLLCRLVDHVYRRQEDRPEMAGSVDGVESRAVDYENASGLH